jgi:HD-GYP domain-containing protein (c-di-GMP phosphodiesterase class II)
VIGAEIVEGIEFLAGAVAVVRHHHERWDGSGYPGGLAQDEIPLAARIFAVGDVLDALTTHRPYRPPSTMTVARHMITGGAATHFDPEVIEVFNRIDDETFTRIAAEIG